MSNSFKKAERLCNKKDIEHLFDKGVSYYIYPFKVLLLVKTDDTLPASVKVLVQVSKRKFKKAVDRNRIKRQIRETYRLQKSSLLQLVSNLSESRNVRLIAGFIYQPVKKEPYTELEQGMKKSLKKISQIITALNGTKKS